jgi:hypothetical protein
MNIQTFSGKSFDLFAPDPSQICITDIAHALSNLCRFTGHGKRFYSIAEHSIHVASLLPAELKLEGLLHDASEAYINDLSTPLKHSGHLDGYRDIEAGLEHAIRVRFNMNYNKLHIKWADKKMLALEADRLLSKPLIPEWKDHLKDVMRPDGIKLPCWSPRTAKIRFLRAFEEYSNFELFAL